MARKESRFSMTIRIAILAVCASTLAIAATTAALAAPREKGRSGFHISENESPRPQDRKTNNAGSGAAKQTIFDRWGRTDGNGTKRSRGGFSSIGDPHETTGDGLGRRKSKSGRDVRRGKTPDDGFVQGFPIPHFSR